MDTKAKFILCMKQIKFDKIKPYFIYGIKRKSYRRFITYDKKKVEKLIEQLNRLGDVSDYHIDDIIDDFYVE